MSFKTVLGVGTGKAVQLEAKGREPHTCAAEKGKAQPPCCCILKVGMQEILSLEEECRELEGKAALLKHVTSA